MIVVAADSALLASCFMGAETIEHSGGHFVPWPNASDPARATITAFLDRMQREA